MMSIFLIHFIISDSIIIPNLVKVVFEVFDLDYYLWKNQVNGWNLLSFILFHLGTPLRKNQGFFQICSISLLIYDYFLLRVISEMIWMNSDYFSHLNFSSIQHSVDSLFQIMKIKDQMLLYTHHSRVLSSFLPHLKLLQSKS